MTRHHHSVLIFLFRETVKTRKVNMQHQATRRVSPFCSSLRISRRVNQLQLPGPRVSAGVGGNDIQALNVFPRRAVQGRCHRASLCSELVFGEETLVQRVSDSDRDSGHSGGCNKPILSVHLPPDAQDGGLKLTTGGPTRGEEKIKEGMQERAERK